MDSLDSAIAARCAAFPARRLWRSLSSATAEGENAVMLRDLFKKKRDVFQKIRHQHQGLSSIDIEVLAFFIVLSELDKQVRGSKVDRISVANIEKTRVESIKASTKKAPKLGKKLMLHAHIIRKLREEDKLSWTQVAEYLRCYCKTTVSHHYLRAFYGTHILPVLEAAADPVEVDVRRG